MSMLGLVSKLTMLRSEWVRWARRPASPRLRIRSVLVVEEHCCCCSVYARPGWEISVCFQYPEMWFVRQKDEIGEAYSSPEYLVEAGKYQVESARKQSPLFYSQVLLQRLLPPRLYLRPCLQFHQALPGSALVPSCPCV